MTLTRKLRLMLPCAVAAALAALSPASAQDVTVTGLSGQTVTLTAADIAALPHVTLTVSVEGKTHTYEGVPLTDILARVAAPAGKALKGIDLTDVVLVTAKDNYAVALSLADTDPMVRKDQIILADKSDGASMSDGLGPYRLVVEGDQRGARMARMVVSIALLRAATSPTGQVH
ncbi:MAG TPA: molybdopterin-dependent oxidoreductase [Caulobacteraceae bacterium]|nr:molybdopterin-dependent oxidoreductase [Caulobacteraceae bacterium]